MRIQGELRSRAGLVRVACGSLGRIHKRWTNYRIFDSVSEPSELKMNPILGSVICEYMTLTEIMIVDLDLNFICNMKGVSADADPHYQKLYGRVTDVCSNRSGQPNQSAME